MTLLERQPLVIDEEVPLLEEQRSERDETGRQKVGRASLAAGQVALAGTMLIGPTVAVETAFRSEVQDSLGPVPISLSLRPDSETKLSFLPKDNIYIDKSRFGVGLNVRLDGFPRSNKHNGNVLASLFSADSVQLYTGFIDQPEQATEGYVQELVDEIKHNLIRNEALVIGGTWLAIGAGAAVQRRRKRPKQKPAEAAKIPSAPTVKTLHNDQPIKHTINKGKESSVPSPRRKNRLAKFMAAAALIGVTVGGGDIATRAAHEDPANHKYELSALDDAGLENTYTDSQAVQGLFQGVPKLINKFNERNEQAMEKFLSTAKSSLAEQVDILAAPKPGEKVIAIASDMHSNKAMQEVLSNTIKTFDDKYSTPNQPGVVLLAMAGDNSYGNAAEKPLIVSQIKMANGEPVVSGTGNHGSKVTMQQFKDAGGYLLEGKTREFDGVSLLGDTDPDITKFGGDTRPRSENGQTHQELGQELYSKAMKDHPTALIAHEGYTAAGGFMGIENVDSKYVMREWFKEGSPWLVPETDDIRDLPTSLVFYGHWHEGNYYRVVRNSDNSHTLVVQLGTAGGAIGTERVDHFSTPLTPPGQEAAFALIYIDTLNGDQVSGYQDVRYETDGQAKISPRVDIENDFQPETDGLVEANPKITPN